MIETEVSPQRVLLVGVQTVDIDDEKFNVLMSELVALTETAGGQVVGEIRQKATKVHQRSLVGSGKLDEISHFVDAHNIDLVVTLNDLSPSIAQNFQEGINSLVADRTQLILDIFAQRAQSREGKLQVELAQYNYLLPRITGQGVSLSRQGGGIGTRGPGETQLEMDRRHIRSRITRIEAELREVEEQRERTRFRRQSGREFNIGLVGYTNAGKSTLLRELTGNDTYVKNQLFATLDPLTRKLKINGHDAFTITDTVGFIEDLPSELIYAFKSTLEEIRYVDVILHVVDASNPAHIMHEETVEQLLQELDMTNIPILTVYNKQDQLQEPFSATLFPNVIISALNPEDIETLKYAIWDICIAHAEYFEVEVLPTEGDLLALYRQKTLVESLMFDEENQVYLLKGYRRRLIDIKES